MLIQAIDQIARPHLDRISSDDIAGPTPEERTLDVGGHSALVIEAGAGRAVVALHGLASVAREIATPLLPLARRYRLIAPDRPGYGMSDALGEPEITPESQAAWLRALLRGLDVRRPIIVAHSIGSAVALTFARLYPSEVAGLVLIAPFCRPTRPALVPLLRLATMPVLGGPFRWIAGRFAARIVPPRLAAAFQPDPVPGYLTDLPPAAFLQPAALVASGAELNGFNRAMMPLALHMRHLRVPSIVLAGRADRTAPPKRHARWLARRLPRARLVTVPSGHMPHHAHPEAVIAAVDTVARWDDRAGVDTQPSPIAPRGAGAGRPASGSHSATVVPAPG